MRKTMTGGMITRFFAKKDNNQLLLDKFSSIEKRLQKQLETKEEKQLQKNLRDKIFGMGLNEKLIVFNKIIRKPDDYLLYLKGLKAIHSWNNTPITETDNNFTNIFGNVWETTYTFKNMIKPAKGPIIKFEKEVEVYKEVKSRKINNNINTDNMLVFIAYICKMIIQSVCKTTHECKGIFIQPRSEINAVLDKLPGKIENHINFTNDTVPLPRQAVSYQEFEDTWNKIKESTIQDVDDTWNKIINESISEQTNVWCVVNLLAHCMKRIIGNQGGIFSDTSVLNLIKDSVKRKMMDQNFNKIINMLTSNECNALKLLSSLAYVCNKTCETTMMGYYSFSIMIGPEMFNWPTDDQNNPIIIETFLMYTFKKWGSYLDYISTYQSDDIWKKGHILSDTNLVGFTLKELRNCANLTHITLSDGTLADVGVRVVANNDSMDNTYNKNDTGVIVGTVPDYVHNILGEVEDVLSNSKIMVRWDKYNIEVDPASLEDDRDLIPLDIKTLNSSVGEGPKLDDYINMKVGSPVVANKNSKDNPYNKGDKGVITQISNKYVFVGWNTNIKSAKPPNLSAESNITPQHPTAATPGHNTGGQIPRETETTINSENGSESDSESDSDSYIDI
jgi:hypothetical protein